MTSVGGKIVLFGSGETAKQGRKIQESLLMAYPRPVRVAIVETPAGFQPNVDIVTQKIATFYSHNLQNAKPAITIVPARKRGSDFDPGDPEIAHLLDDADVIFSGPGSPSYTIRQLQDSATLQKMRNALSRGATVILASAAALAVGRKAIPVYEIYKVGDDPVWIDGLNLLADFGLNVAVVAHWNNSEGGPELDTSHAFIGADRFESLLAHLPLETTVLGVDEHTAVILEQTPDTARVEGAGVVTVISGTGTHIFPAGSIFPLSLLRESRCA